MGRRASVDDMDLFFLIKLNEGNLHSTWILDEIWLYVIKPIA